MSYAVARRAREIGVRLALGARPSGVLAIVMRETLLLVAIGLALGIPASWLTGRYAAALLSDGLFGLQPTDATTLMMSVGLMIVVAPCAGLLPAWRAARVDPAQALRRE